MNTVDLRTGARPAGALQHACQAGRAPDYHALGTFSETWSFLEYFLERCVQAGGEAACDQPLSLAVRLDALERLDFGAQRSEAAALAVEVRALAHRRQAALQDLARASLSRMGLGQFDASAAPPAADGDKALEVLHMRTCDLVRRAVLLLCALEKARA